MCGLQALHPSNQEQREGKFEFLVKLNYFVGMCYVP